MDAVGQTFFNRIKKARFDHLYDLPDCRRYYQTLSSLEYQIPTHTVPLVRDAVRAIGELRGLAAPWIVDVAGGYGIAPALLRHETTMRAVFERYQSNELVAADPDAVIESDRQWYEARRRPGRQPRVVGIDVSGSALAYARRANLYDETFIADLERDEPLAPLSARLAEASLVIEMGAIGYIGANTFRRLLHAIGEPSPWLVIAPTRVADSAPILDLLDRAGLRVERATPSPFRHRRFTGDEERMRAISEIERKGLDPSGLEDTGFYYADAYVAAPAHELSGVRQRPRND